MSAAASARARRGSAVSRPGWNAGAEGGLATDLFVIAIDLADHIGQLVAPWPRHDPKGLGDPAAVEHRISWPGRGRRVFGGGDRLDLGRWAAPKSAELPGQRKDRLGKAMPADRAGAGKVIGAPRSVS